MREKKKGYTFLFLVARFANRYLSSREAFNGRKSFNSAYGIKQ